MLANGDGIAKDAVKVFKWYRRAAPHGDANAQLNLGYAHFTGNGVSKDNVEAVQV